MAYKNKADLIAYRKAHRKEANERARVWRLAHPEEAKAKTRECRARNREAYAAQHRLYRAANREKVRAAARAWRAKNNYAGSPKRKAENLRAALMVHGLRPEDYRRLLAAQGGGCAICATPSPGMKNAKRLYVDHCHKTDEIRGLLCFRCNMLLANADDSPDRLHRAARYLAENRSGIVRGERRSLLGS